VAVDNASAWNVASLRAARRILASVRPKAAKPQMLPSEQQRKPSNEGFFLT
jgi:hypothetical protein